MMIQRIYLFLLSFHPFRALQSEGQTAREGEAVTLQPHLTGAQVNCQLLWSFGENPPYKAIAQLHNGQTKTDYIKRFRDRLQLHRQTGCLTISNLNTDDSGVYQIQIIDEGLSKMFHLTVHSHVSRPQIRLLNHSPDNFLKPPASVYELQSNSSCSALCSVENGREVTLSWQREGEILNHTSSPDLTTNLSLPLEIEENSTPYSCVAANPVSNETALLNTELCAQYRAPTATVPVSRSLVAVWVMLAVFLLCCVCVTWRWRKRRKDGAPLSLESSDVIYKSVRIKPRSPALKGLRNHTEDREEETEIKCGRGREGEPSNTEYILINTKERES